MAKKIYRRKTVIEKFETAKTQLGDEFHPHPILTGGELWDTCYYVRINVRTSIFSEHEFILACKDIEEVGELEAVCPEGGEFDKENPPALFIEIRKRSIEGLDFYGRLAFGEDTDLESPVLDTLHASGLWCYENIGELSKQVLSYLGEERISELKSEFGTKWGVAAQWEYCQGNLHKDCRVYLASEIQFVSEIVGNHRYAGKLEEQLSNLLNDVEQDAVEYQPVKEGREKGGNDGGAKMKAQSKENQQIFHGLIRANLDKYLECGSRGEQGTLMATKVAEYRARGGEYERFFLWGDKPIKKEKLQRWCADFDRENKIKSIG